MAMKTLGIKKDKPSGCRYNFQPFEHEFMDFWGSLGFRLEKDKNSLSYRSSIASLRKVLKGYYEWSGPITLQRLKEYVEIFKDHSKLNKFLSEPGAKGFQDPTKLYFHQFVQTFSGYSYLRDVIEGKFRKITVHKDLESFSKEVAGIISEQIGRKSFSSGETARISNFSREILNFYEKNADKIATGIDKMTIVSGVVKVINSFVRVKGINKNLLIYTGNYAAGAALTQAMDQFSYWKIYEKQEDINTCANKDPEKVKQVMAEKKKKEEDSLPDVVKRRREEMKNNGIEIKQKEEEDCSRRDEFLRKKNERRNPFSSRKK